MKLFFNIRSAHLACILVM